MNYIIFFRLCKKKCNLKWQGQRVFSPYLKKLCNQNWNTRYTSSTLSIVDYLFFSLYYYIQTSLIYIFIYIYIYIYGIGILICVSFRTHYAIFSKPVYDFHYKPHSVQYRAMYLLVLRMLRTLSMYSQLNKDTCSNARTTTCILNREKLKRSTTAM